MTEPRTRTGERLLTDIINDHEAPSYHVIGMVRRAIPEIEAEAGALDAAWKRAESALPEGWAMSGLLRWHGALLDVADSGWQATCGTTDAAYEIVTFDKHPSGLPSIYGFDRGIGATPTAALMDLAARLGADLPSEAPE